MEFLMMFILGVLILPAIIYFTVRTAVKEGTYDALIEYDEYKRKKGED